MLLSKVNVPTSVTYLNQTPTFERYVVWHVPRKLVCMFWNLTIILGSIGNIYWGDLYDLLSTKIFTLKMKERDIHTSSEDFEESGYGLNVDVLTVSHWSRVSNPRRSGLVDKSNHWKPIYLSPLWHTKSITNPVEAICEVILKQLTLWRGDACG